jgi:zinc protease
MTDYFTPDGQLRPCILAGNLYTAALPSGLKVVIKTDRRTPVAVCNVWVKVGSNREPEPLRGWSHGIEHMLFKGTGTRNEGDFAREVAEAGGSTNAGTGYETTNYHITLPAENLPVAVDILGDALLGSVFEAASLDAERKVLVHENHMYDDIPFGFGVTWRWAMELAFDQSPYRHPIGGRDENLLERDREDILAFYRSAYRPDNMTVVVVGDVDPDEALALVKEKFTPQPDQHFEPVDTPRTLVSRPGTEQSHDRCRIRVEQGDIKRAYCKLVFPGPGENDPSRPVMSVARRVLSDGRSCRLFRHLQEELKLVDDFALMSEAGPREGVIILDLETDVERLPRAITAVARILTELAQDGCTEAELDRARIRVARSFLFGDETVQGQASTLGYHEAMGDLEGAFAFPDRVARVTRNDVAALCRQLFRHQDLSCVIYLPQGTDPAALGIPTDQDELEVLLQGFLSYEDDLAALEKSDLPAPLVNLNRKPQPTEPVFVAHRLSNGAALHYQVDHTLPILGLTMTVKGGATTETVTSAGLSTLMQMVQIKGTGNLVSEQIHSTLEGEGASLSPRTERDFSGLSFSALSDRLDRAMALMGQVATAPSFPPEEIEQERRLAQEQLASLDDNPFQAAAVEMRKLLYGDHPYGRPLAGTLESLPLLTREHLMERHHQAWTAANLQIVVAGSFEPERLTEQLNQALRDLPAGHALPDPAPGPALVPAGVVSRKLDKEQNQSVVLVGWPGVTNPNTHRPEILMLKEVLNGQAGRLFEALRNQRSLCYNTGTLSTAGFGQGMFLGYVLTSPESENEARQALVEELIRMTAQSVPDPEFNRARAKLIGNILVSSQSNSAKVVRASQDLLFGRDPNGLPQLVEGIRNCTPEDVRRMAQDLFTAHDRYEVTIGP